jgi:hypothetical protein
MNIKSALSHFQRTSDGTDRCARIALGSEDSTDRLIGDLYPRDGRHSVNEPIETKLGGTFAPVPSLSEMPTFCIVQGKGEM